MSAERALRVTQVSSSDIGGGAERIAADLHRGAPERGIDSCLAVGFRFGQIPGSVEIPNDANRSPWARAVLSLVPDLPAPPARLSMTALAVRRGLKALAEPARAVRRAQGFEDFVFPGTEAVPGLAGGAADLLHLHNLHGGYFDLRALPRLSSHTPVVITLHDTWLTSGHCAYTLECERWRTGCGACPHLDTAPAVPRDRTAENWQRKRDILRRSRIHVVGPSEWVLRRVPESIIAAGAVDMCHIPNGVDQRVFAPADKVAARRALGLPEAALVLVFSAASPTSLYKDAATIAAALPEIARRVAPREVVFLSLGAVADPVAAPGVDVRSIPFTADTSVVARYLQAADLMLHAARAENHPLAVLEAQSCGVPVVASNIGGVPETLVDGRTGLLVPPSDPGALAEAASALLTDESRRQAMGAAALANATECYGLDRMLDAYVSLYRTIAGRT